MRKFLAVLLAVATIFTFVPAPLKAQQGISTLSRVAGVYVAASYGQWQTTAFAGNGATGSSSMIMRDGFVVLADGTTFNPYFINERLLIDLGTSISETVTITAVSNCGVGVQQNSCTITASFTNLHGGSANVRSGSFGLDEALNQAQTGIGGNNSGLGGVAVVDRAWGASGGTTAILAASQVYPSVSIADERFGVLRFWSPTPTGAALAAPAGITVTGQLACDATHQACSDASVVGSASWGGAIFIAVAYVDIMGNEGPASATTTWTSAASKAIDIGAPPASPGAVGFTVYLSLSGGTYAQAYRMELTSADCTLTTLETTTPACAVANSTFGQSASTFGAAGLFTTGGAQFSGTRFPVNTGMHFPTLASTAMTAASMAPVTNSSVTYSYAPGNRVGLPGISSANVVNYGISGSTATTIPNAIATWTIPAGQFNFIGAEFNVSGFFTFTDGGDTSDEIRVAWDAPGTNTTTIPTALCALKTTATGAGAAQNGTYSCTVKVATIGATGTALVNGWGDIALAAGQTTLVRSSLATAVAPSASINLTAPARIVVYYIGTGATNNPGAQGLSATLTALN